MIWGSQLWLCAWMVACDNALLNYRGALLSTDSFVEWAQRYLSPRWLGHSVFDAVRIELQERDQEWTQLMLTLEKMTTCMSVRGH